MPVPNQPFVLDLDECDTIVVVYKGGKSRIWSERSALELLHILEPIVRQMGECSTRRPPREMPLHHYTPPPPLPSA